MSGFKNRRRVRAWRHGLTNYRIAKVAMATGKHELLTVQVIVAKSLIPKPGMAELVASEAARQARMAALWRQAGSR